MKKLSPAQLRGLYSAKNHNLGQGLEPDVSKGMSRTISSKYKSVFVIHPDLLPSNLGPSKSWDTESKSFVHEGFVKGNVRVNPVGVRTPTVQFLLRHGLVRSKSVPSGTRSWTTHPITPKGLEVLSEQTEGLVWDETVLDFVEAELVPEDNDRETVTVGELLTTIHDYLDVYGTTSVNLFDSWDREISDGTPSKFIGSGSVTYSTDCGLTSGSRMEFFCHLESTVGVEGEEGFLRSGPGLGNESVLILGYGPEGSDYLDEGVRPLSDIRGLHPGTELVKDRVKWIWCPSHLVCESEGIQKRYSGVHPVFFGVQDDDLRVPERN